MIGSRKRNQPAPPRVIFDALVDPDLDPVRPWLILLDDEQRPRILSAEAPSKICWSSLWMKRPDAVIEFELLSDGGDGTGLQWTLLVAEPVPDDALIGHLRKRMACAVRLG